MSIDVLIVDDSAVMRAMIAKSLKMAGLPLKTIHHAGNGAEALELLGRESVDLALVDINMPVMGGEEMIERMQEDPTLSKVPIVVISTEASNTRITRLIEHGVKFIHKPFTPEEIRDVVGELTEIEDGR
jgi:two-component system chemotaxis response regulator CheY